MGNLSDFLAGKRSSKVVKGVKGVGLEKLFYARN
jgi:hypothetical protein